MAGKDAVEKQELLKKCAMTTLSSKLVGGEKEFFGKMCVDAVMVRAHTAYVRATFAPHVCLSPRYSTNLHR